MAVERTGHVALICQWRSQTFIPPPSLLTTIAAWHLQDSVERGAFLREVRRPQAGPRVPMMLAVALDIARAVEFLHSHGIVHGGVLVHPSPSPIPKPSPTLHIGEHGCQRLGSYWFSQESVSAFWTLCTDARRTHAEAATLAACAWRSVSTCGDIMVPAA